MSIFVLQLEIGEAIKRLFLSFSFSSIHAHPCLCTCACTVPFCTAVFGRRVGFLFRHSCSPGPTARSELWTCARMQEEIEYSGNSSDGQGRKKERRSSAKVNSSRHEAAVCAYVRVVGCFLPFCFVHGIGQKSQDESAWTVINWYFILHSFRVSLMFFLSSFWNCSAWRIKTNERRQNESCLAVIRSFWILGSRLPFSHAPS